MSEKSINKLRKKRDDLLARRDWRGAIKVLEQIIEIEPSAKRTANLSQLLMRVGRHREALAKIQAARELDPQLPGIDELVAKIERRTQYRKNLRMVVVAFALFGLAGLLGFIDFRLWSALHEKRLDLLQVKQKHEQVVQSQQESRTTFEDSQKREKQLASSLAKTLEEQQQVQKQVENRRDLLQEMQQQPGESRDLQREFIRIVKKTYLPGYLQAKDVDGSLGALELLATENIVAEDFLVKRLGDMDEQAVPSLVRALDNDLVKDYARVAFREMRERAVPALARVLRTGNPTARRHSVKMLTQIGPKARYAMNELTSSFGKNSHAEIKEDIAIALVVIDSGKAATISAISNFLKDQKLVALVEAEKFLDQAQSIEKTAINRRIAAQNKVAEIRSTEDQAKARRIAADQEASRDWSGMENRARQERLQLERLAAERREEERTIKTRKENEQIEFERAKRAEDTAREEKESADRRFEKAKDDEALAIEERRRRRTDLDQAIEIEQEAEAKRLEAERRADAAKGTPQEYEEERKAREAREHAERARESRQRVEKYFDEARSAETRAITERVSAESIAREKDLAVIRATEERATAAARLQKLGDDENAVIERRQQAESQVQQALAIERQIPLDRIRAEREAKEALAHEQWAIENTRQHMPAAQNQVKESLQSEAQAIATREEAVREVGKCKLAIRRYHW